MFRIQSRLELETNQPLFNDSPNGVKYSVVTEHDLHRSTRMETSTKYSSHTENPITNKSGVSAINWIKFSFHIQRGENTALLKYIPFHMVILSILGLKGHARGIPDLETNTPSPNGLHRMEYNHSFHSNKNILFIKETAHYDVKYSTKNVFSPSYLTISIRTIL
uniref:Uncharacterized protein n=1 Tax=Heterorhabditis bacteriophora TaxID=37862 RepID=A0A1I7WCX3_HETBA